VNLDGAFHPTGVTARDASGRAVLGPAAGIRIPTPVP
jgi:hypothetical protein